MIKLCSTVGHDGDPPGMDGLQVAVLEEANRVGLEGFVHCVEDIALPLGALEKVRIIAVVFAL